MNELRRTKEKLAVLQITDAPITQVLFDVIDLVEKDITSETQDSRPYSQAGKEYIVEKLRLIYQSYVGLHTPKSKKQTKLFE